MKIHREARQVFDRIVGNQPTPIRASSAQTVIYECCIDEVVARRSLQAVSRTTESARDALRRPTPLPTLYARRRCLGEAVARIKWRDKLPVEDLIREQTMLKQRKRQAAGLGLPPVPVEQLFRAQITVSKSIQRDLLETWAHHPGPDVDVGTHLDLATHVRPRIDAIDAEILRSLASDSSVFGSV